MGKKFLIVSPNGFGNIGDDICAYAGVYAIKQADGGAETKVVSPPMKQTDIDWADYVILSGGGIIYDRAEKNVANYMDFIDAAVLAGKKAAVMGVGAQGIVTDEGRERYKESLNKCEFVSVRTDEDKQMLEEIGVAAQATFDIAYFTPEMVPDLPSSPSFFQRRRLDAAIQTSSQKPQVGICVINLKALKRDNYPGSVFETFDQTIDSFVAVGKDSFDITIMQHGMEDRDLSRALAKKHGVGFMPYKNIDDVSRFYERYQQLDLMIGVRLHAIALGIMSGTPTIGIGSNGAKQKRLIDYALPSMQDNFYEFNRVDELNTRLSQMAETGKIDIKPVSDKDARAIEKLNNKNVELIESMLAR